MANFCNKCAWDMWGDRFPPEINVPRIFTDQLEEGYCKQVMCEGCDMMAIGKLNGQLVLAFRREQPQPADLDEYILPKNKRKKLCQK